jgi:hypothetical protein
MYSPDSLNTLAAYYIILSPYYLLFSWKYQFCKTGFENPIYDVSHGHAQSNSILALLYATGYII